MKKFTWFYLVFLLFLFNPSIPTLLEVPQTGGKTSDIQENNFLSDLRAFQKQIDSGKTFAGLFAPNEFAYPVVLQPQNAPAYVSSRPDELTYFALAEKYGSVGLLAHNTLAGKDFYSLNVGDEVGYYQNGIWQWYRVEKILQFQALTPESPTSDFRDLEHPERVLSASRLFQEIYAQPGKLILQTCLTRGQNNSWGRVFIVATPIPLENSKMISFQIFSANPPSLLETIPAPR